MGLRYHEHRGGGHHQHGSHLGGTEVNLSKLLLGSTRIRRILLVLSFLDILCTRVGISQGHTNQAFTHDHVEPDIKYIQVDPVVDDSANLGGDGTLLPSAAPSPTPLRGELNNKKPPDNTVEEESDILKFPVRFEPGELDFGKQPIGLPVLRKVSVYNLNAQSSIQMLSISGNTIHFHCSFFADKVIPPSGNTSFDVVFLGRDEGLVENTLYIHTSAGSFRFIVSAVGTPNPYRLKPLVGVKMPLNSSYSPMITLHNPHPEPIQVLEMYSSGGDLHLELPGGETEGPQALWQIPPFQTKSVMKANFLARLESNHTAYIRIKTNTTGAEFLYLPLEVEVSSAPGIYCPQELIDFGLVPSDAGPRTAKVFLLNSGHKSVPVQNVVVTPVSEAVTVTSFKPQKISPDTLRPATVAEVTFDPSLVANDGTHTGRIVIKSKNSQFKVTIPYHAQVVTGDVAVADDTITRFHLSHRNPSTEKEMSRNFAVKNTFPVAVAVHNVSLGPPQGGDEVGSQRNGGIDDSGGGFRIESFVPTVIGPGQTKDNLFILTLPLSSDGNEGKSDEEAVPGGRRRRGRKSRVLDTYVTLWTNVTVIKIPVMAFHGLVHTLIPDGGMAAARSQSRDNGEGGEEDGYSKELDFEVLEDEDDLKENILDFGTLGMEEKRDLYFAVLNKNPVALTLKDWGANLTGCLLELMGLEKGGVAEVLAREGNYTGMSRPSERHPLRIPPGHYVVFRVGIYTPSHETAETNSSVFVETDYQRLDVKFRFRVTKGSLSTFPSDLVFEPAFPGKSVRLKLEVYSSFSEEMITDSVIAKNSPSSASGGSQPSSFSFVHNAPGLDGRAGITPGEKSFIGHVVYDPAAGCRDQEDCYTGFPITSKLGSEWFKYYSLWQPVEDAVAATDAAIGHALQKSFKGLVSKASFNITLNLDTNKVRGFLFRARASLVWPRVTAPSEGTFPLTQVGNSSIHEVFVTNPADSHVYVHLVPFSVYPSANVMLTKLMPPWALAHLNGSIDDLLLPEGDPDAAESLSSVFRILNVQDDNGTLIGLTHEVERRFGKSLNPNTKAFKLAAGHRARIRVRFTPEVEGSVRHGIFVRNNLTGIEVATFRAEGVKGEFKLGKFRHNHPKPEEMVLDFDMKEKHLKDCDRARRYSSPVLSVKRSIKMKNTGATTLYIRGFEVEGIPCEGYGFKVLNCQGFDLPPSEVKEIDIAFSPDFTLTKVTRKLTILSNINKDMVNYTLVATLPAHMLGACGSVLPRPSWESWMYHIVNVFMAIVLVIVLVSAFMDSDRIVRFTAFSQPAAAAALLVQQPHSADNGQRPYHQQGYQRLDLKEVADKVNQELNARQRMSVPASHQPRAQSNGLRRTPSSEVGRNQQPQMVVPTPPPCPSLWSRMVNGFYQVIETYKASVREAQRLEAERKSREKQQQQRRQSEQQATAPSATATSADSQENKSFSTEPTGMSPLPYKRKGKKGKKGRGSNGAIQNHQHASDKVPPTGSGVKARGSLEDVETSSTTTESSESFAADQRDIDDLSKPSTGKGSKKNNKQQASSKIAAEAVKKSAVAAATGKQPSGKNSGCKQATAVEKKAVVNCVKANNATAGAAGEKQVTSVKANGATTKPGLVKQKSTDGTDGVGSVSSSPVLSSAANATPPPFEPQQQPVFGKKCANNVPVGKILPEPKKQPENGKFGPVGSGHNKPALAAANSSPLMSMRPSSRMSAASSPQPTLIQQASTGSAGQATKRDFWHSDSSSGVLDAVVPPPPSFSGTGSSSRTSQQQQQQQPSSLGFGEGYDYGSTGQGGNGGGNAGNDVSNQSSVSLMKTLQEERRQMTEKYLTSTRDGPGTGNGSGADWPGFDSNSFSGNGGVSATSDFISNLWDYRQELPSAAAAAAANAQHQNNSRHQAAVPSSTSAFGWPSTVTGGTAPLTAPATSSTAGFWSVGSDRTFGGFVGGADEAVGGGMRGLNGQEGGGRGGLPVDVASIWSTNPLPSMPPPHTALPPPPPPTASPELQQHRMGGLRTRQHPPPPPPPPEVVAGLNSAWGIFQQPPPPVPNQSQQQLRTPPPANGSSEQKKQ